MCSKEFCPEKQLIDEIKEDAIIRVGATINPDRRLKEHKKTGYRGSMMFVETNDMKEAEDRILDACDSCSHNIQKSSNIPVARHGYVYGIKGYKK